jgi:hypothetical protein
MTGATIEAAASRLATLLTAGGEGAIGPGEPWLDFEHEIRPRPLSEGEMPADVWAVDGGQAVVADARCLQVVVTRTARVRFRAGACELQEAEPLRAYLLGGVEGRTALAQLGLPLPPTTAIDANLIRDRWEWDAIERCVGEADEGALVLVDGDLWPDWRIATDRIGSLLERARQRSVLVVGVTKHSSLSRGGAPLLGQLEAEAEESLGPEARWWAPVAHSRPEQGNGQAASAATGPADTNSRPAHASSPPATAPSPPAAPLAVQVVAAKLDPASRFAFRVDIPDGAPAEPALGALAAVADDAAFPGYPYPLAVADGFAACPRWVREEAWLALDQRLDEAGVDLEVRERAFADRHRLMERA